jgi:outer membrane protein TolC
MTWKTSLKKQLGPYSGFRVQDSGSKIQNLEFKIQDSRFRIQDSEFNLQFERKNLENKIKSQQQEIVSLEKQQDYNDKLVKDFTKLLNAEDRLFEMGESSLFIINSRENSLVSSQLNEIALENRYLNAIISIYKTLANPN